MFRDLGTCGSGILLCGGQGWLAVKVKVRLRLSIRVRVRGR